MQPKVMMKSLWRHLSGWRFSQHQELSNAQIIGAAAAVTTSAQRQNRLKKGKTKTRRLFRK